MSIIQGTAKSGGATAGGFYDYPIEQSLRFDGNSYLSFTPTSTGNSNIWTLSVWVKQSKEFAGIIFNSGTSTRFLLGPYSTNGFYVLRYPNYPILVYTNAKHRDLSAFYHFVVEVNTNQSSLADAIKIYQNGELLTFSSTTYSSTTLNTNTTGVPMYIGQDGVGTNRWNGYMSNIELVDGYKTGTTLATYSDFGELKNGVWVPKEYTGTYGTNGFHLDFADPNNIGNDVSGNNNHWTVN